MGGYDGNDVLHTYTVTVHDIHNRRYGRVYIYSARNFFLNFFFNFLLGFSV